MQKKAPLLLMVMVSFLFFCGTASASELPVTTNHSGTVSGDLYVNATQPTPFNEQDLNSSGVTQEASFNFAPSGYTNVTYAKLYTLVYVAGTEYRECVVNVSFDGNNDGIYETILESGTTLKTPSSGDGTVYWQNDHISRVYSDYLLTYDVTSYINSGTVAAKVQTARGSSNMDGRIKYLALVVAYNDGDNDRIQYWINDGHQWFSSQNTRQTTFDTSNITPGWDNAELEVVHSSTTDAGYNFNGETKVGNSPPGGIYFMVNNWNVTDDLTAGESSTLKYTHNQGASCKITIATLKVHYTGSADTRAELVQEGFVVPDGLVANQTYQLNAKVSNYGNADAGTFVVTLYDNDQPVESQTVNGLAKGTSKTVTFNWKPDTAGSHNMKVIIDLLNQVEESNETNNQFNKLVNVEIPRSDLVTTNLTVPENPLVNQTYHLNATIKNQGLADAGSFVVQLYDGSILGDSKTVNGLVAGGTNILEFDWKPVSIGSHDLKLLLDTTDKVDEANETNNQFNRYVIMGDESVINVFIISDSPGTNIANMAAQEILQDLDGTVSIQIRSCAQVEAMSEDELRAYLGSCDIFIGEWITTDAATLLTEVLTAHPEVANKLNGVFLILEPPVSVTPSSVALMKYSSINGVKLLENFSTEQLMDYYQHTTTGSDYNDTVNYLKTVNFPDSYNKATLYKNLNDKVNLHNQILWALNLIGFQTNYQEPTFSFGKQEYGIYRYRWYTLEEYMAAYFDSSRQGCVGIIESTKYVNAQELQPYYAIIEALEARGLNVIPVTAYGGSEEQLKVMLEYFTNATDINSFLLDPTKYLSRVDAIVSMPAYGLGGDNFTATTNFFDALGVPVFRAIHSDSLSNAEWYLSTSGLPTNSGDKWWHIAIEEAQGEIDPTFVGGMSTVIDSSTGAAIVGYVPQEENINSMADKVKGWVQLTYTVNALKKVALIYYNYPPGKNNIGASYLDPIQSILNLLNILKSQGYTVENIPANATELEKLMLAQGINVANWAPGEVEKLANNTNVVLYSVDEYMVWFKQLDELTQLYVTQGPVAYIGELCKKAVQLGYASDPDYIQELNDKIDSWQTQILTLVPTNQTNAATPLLNGIASSLKNYVSTQNTSYWNDYLDYKVQFLALNVSGMSGWGEAPGDIMVVERNGKKYFVLPGIQFGNVFIGPEPQRGWEGDIDKLYHSTVVPPHHQYLAFFAWLQQQGTDAMVYIGRHATHEWLPGKEVILAPTDFPNIVTGSVPQIYFYISDGLAEGIQAKRRANAVIIDHLTPPMTYTSLYGGLAQLAQLAEDYDSANSTEKLSIISQIRDLIATNDLESGMGVDTDVLNGDDLIKAVNAYISDIQGTLYPYGLDVIGQKWSDEQIALMVTSMLSVAFQTSGGGETTLQNEISLIFLGKTESALSATEKDEVQGLCVGVVESLIYSNATAIASELTSNPSNNFILALEKAKTYINLLNESVDNEIKSFLTALNGGFIAPGPGGDPISNPDVLPTGRNFYQDQAAEIPTKEAYEYGKTLALLLLSGINDSTNKVAIGIWCVETARDDGALVSMVLYLLGMEPQWSDSPSAGVNGQKLKEMPVYVELNDLVRPAGWSKKRIDAIIITSGLFRDLYSRQAGLLDNAFRIALARSYYTILEDSTLKAKYGDKIKAALDPIMEGIGYYGVGSESLNDNYVALDWVNDFEYYLSLNMTPEDAGEMAISRIFAPPEGDYGAGISKALEMSWTWNSTDDLAKYYLERMGHIYSQNNWGTSNPAVFARALTGISTMYSSRNTNLYGVLDNDDYVDYWGGLYNALKYVNNGNSIRWNVLYYPNPDNPQSLSIQQSISRELTTRYLNPNYNDGMMSNGGYSTGRYLAKAISNFWKFSDIAPGLTTDGQWNQWAVVYYGSNGNNGLGKWMAANNPFAAQMMISKFLNAAMDGNWKGYVTSPAILQQMIEDLGINVRDNSVSCCDCVCGNVALMTWAASQMSPELAAQFKEVLYQATQRKEYQEEEQEQEPEKPKTKPQELAAVQKGQIGATGDQATTDTSDEKGEGSTNEVGDEAGEMTQKSYEVSKSTPSGSAQSGLPFAAVFGVILLVLLVGVGYFKGNIIGLFSMFKK
jgi:cobaltochelatase CobN